MTDSTNNRIRLKPDAKQRIRLRRLNDRERAFVDHYCVLLNANAALYAAGIAPNSPKGALGYARALMKDPDIRCAIDIRMEYLAAKCEVTKDRVTKMMVDVYDRSMEHGQLAVASKVAFDLAKLHGLIVDQRQVISWRLEDLSEGQIEQFLGRRYDPSKVKALVDARGRRPIEGKAEEVK